MEDLINGVEWFQLKWLLQVEGFNQGQGKVTKVKNAGMTRDRVWTALGKSVELLGVVRLMNLIGVKVSSYAWNDYFSLFFLLQAHFLYQYD